MNKDVKEILAKRASEFQLMVLKDLLDHQDKISFEERNEVLSKLQTTLSEFLEVSITEGDSSFNLPVPLGVPKSKVDDEKKALIEKLRKIIDKYNISYGIASTKLDIAAGPLYNWLKGKTLPNRISFNKLKEGVKKLNAELCAKEKKPNDKQESGDIPF